jgi:hypothetical protein
MKKIFGAIVISVILLSAAVSAQSLKIDNFSIKLNNETEVISVKKDGKIIVNGKQIGVLQADGKLIDLQGKTVAEIDKTGLVTVNAKPLLVISKDGDISNGSGKTMAWAWGEFNLSESQFLTVSPNKKEFYQPASFLIFLYLTSNEVIIESPVVSLKNDKLVEGKFKYKESDLVASVSASAMRGDYSIKVFGDGRIRVAGESFEAKKVPSNKKQVQAKINLFLQKAEAIDFVTIGKKSLASTFRLVQDGYSQSTGVWQNGIFQRAGCSSARDYCPQEIKELHNYFLTLFADDIVRRKL